jgi:tripartite-type tricarboxylate transporter receptor subunit TctC
MHSTVARALGAFVVCFGSFATALSPALAEVWPQRGVKIITSFPAGTGGDLSARLYAERLALRWGKPVIVENKPGADGILAVTAVIGARDNHTLLYTNGGPVTTNGFNHDKLPYDPVRDLIGRRCIDRGLDSGFIEDRLACGLHRLRAGATR